MNRQLPVSFSEKGQSMMELAFSLVLLLLLLAGVIDLGRAFFTYMALRDAAQEGAVYGSMCPANTSEIVNRVRSASTQPVNLKDTAHVLVDCYYLTNNLPGACDPNQVPAPGQGVKVRVRYNDFRITMPFLGALIGRQSVNLSAEVSDTILRTAPCP